MTISLNVGASSAIFDYATLVSECEDQLDRDDLTAKFPRFVQMVEAYLKKRLRTLDQETITQWLVSSETTALPDDCLSIRSLYIEGQPDRPLRQVSYPSQEFSGAANTPVAYSRIGDTLKLAPPPDSEIVLEMAYTARFTPLTAESVSNWIIGDHPDLYFYGTLAHAFAYISDTANAQIYGDLFESAINTLVEARNRDRFGSGLQVPSGVRQVAGARC